MRPLEGIKIIDLSQAYAGPFATQNLADHGAEVIKIERPGIGDQVRTWKPIRNGESGFHVMLNRNKRGMTLDLKQDEGKQILRELLRDADVIVENYKLGVMDRLGFSYEEMKKINKGIIYANVTGFGINGPLANRPCYDIVAQAMGGMMDVTGQTGEIPTKIGPAIADSYTGAMLCIGILMALYKREKTGEGCHLDVAMVDTMMSVLDHFLIDYTINGEVNSRSGNNDQAIAPFDSFQAKDGMCVIACGTDSMFEKLCDLIGRPDLPKDERFATNVNRCIYYTALKPELEAWTSEKTEAELEEILVNNGIPFGNIQNMEQLANSPQTKARNMLWEVDQPGMGKVVVTGTPIKMSYEEDELIKPAPVLGEDNDMILNLLGYSADNINKLRERGVI